MDVLRVVAALSVVLFHYTFRGHAQGAMTRFSDATLSPVTQYGYLGVPLFFAISGFVILMSASNMGVGAFLRARAARIYPAFWITCTLTTVIAMAFHEAGAPTIHATQYLANMLLLSNLLGYQPIAGVYWSLFVELHLYMITVVIIATGLLKRIELVLWLWLVLSVLSIPLHLELVRVVLCADYAPLFIGGACGYLAYRACWNPRTALLFLGSAIAACQHEIDRATILGSAYHVSYDNRYIVAAMVAIFACIAIISVKKRAIMNSKALMLAGAVTYPLYLFHELPGYLLLDFLMDKTSHALMLTITAMVLCAIAIQRLGERPIYQRLRARKTVDTNATSVVCERSARGREIS